MPEIRDLGTRSDGTRLQGYEVEFDSIKEPWSEYQLSDGTKVRVRNTVLKMFRLVDENHEPSLNETGDPDIFLTGNVLIVTSKAKVEN
jgi:hypothetical protein